MEMLAGDRVDGARAQAAPDVPPPSLPAGDASAALGPPTYPARFARHGEQRRAARR